MSERFWRSLIGIAVAYAVAAQSLLIAIGGFGLPLPADTAAPAFELCLHDGQGSAQLPAGVPDHAACTHCIFCFAGAHHALIGSPASAIRRAAILMTAVAWTVHTHRPIRLPAYTIASPRGPPPGV